MTSYVRQFTQLPKEFEMAAPYTVTITVTNSHGQEMTVLKQSLNQYVELVAYQKALAMAIMGLGDAGVQLKQAEKKDK